MDISVFSKVTYLGALHCMYVCMCIWINVFICLRVLEQRDISFEFGVMCWSWASCQLFYIVYTVFYVYFGTYTVTYMHVCMYVGIVSPVMPLVFDPNTCLLLNFSLCLLPSTFDFSHSKNPDVYTWVCSCTRWQRNHQRSVFVRCSLVSHYSACSVDMDPSEIYTCTCTSPDTFLVKTHCALEWEQPCLTH